MSATTLPQRAAHHPVKPARPPGASHPAPTGAARLLSTPADGTLAAHLDHWGALQVPGDLIDEIAGAGLRGRGGAGFPTARKMLEVRRSASVTRRPVVVANGTESEPVSSKDRVLLRINPHLVLDGMVAAALAVGAREAILCIKDAGAEHELAKQLERAMAERAATERIDLSMSRVPGSYVAGEETALVNWLSSGTPLPTLSPPRPAQRGVGRRPTLVDNVETLAHIALIARFGARWWQQAGAAGHQAGTTLVTVTGGVQRPGVREVPVGAPLARVLDDAGAGPASGVLVGGYFGTWLSPERAHRALLEHESLQKMGAGLGCGAIVVLPETACPLNELTRVTRWMAGQSAGQCGPCTNGLPAIASAVEEVAAHGSSDAVGAARRWSEMVKGRGACRLPDGAIKFVESGLDVFADHIDLHRWRGPCQADPVLPVPAVRPSGTRLVLDGRR